MADKPAVPPKRRVKNPETFRERSLKAVVASEKPGITKRIKSASGKLAKPVARPIFRALGRVVKVQPFKSIYKLLRLVGLVILPPYLRSSWKELELVTWPNRKQSRQLTLAVLIFAVVFGAVVALVDYGLDKVFRQILLK